MKYKFEEVAKWMEWAKTHDVKFLSFEESNASSERSSYQSAAVVADDRKEGRNEKIRTKLTIEFEYDITEKENE